MLFVCRAAEEQLLKLRKYEYQMFLDNRLPPMFSSARAQAARYISPMLCLLGTLYFGIVPCSGRQAH